MYNDFEFHTILNFPICSGIPPFIFIILIFAGGWVAILEFNLDLGLDRISKPINIERNITVFDSILAIPMSEYNAMGKIEAVTGDTVRINKHLVSKVDSNG